MQLADTFNDSHKGLVAYVTKAGSNYEVYVKDRDSITQHNISLLKEMLSAWHIYESTFQNVGIDLNTVPDIIKGTVTPYVPGLAGYFKSLQGTSHRNLYKRDAMVLFELGLDANWKQILQNTFGSIEAAADAVDALNHGGIAA